MKHVPVKSSHVKSVAHDPESNCLEVKFKDGSVHQYPGVSAEEHEKLMKAESVGEHLAKHIKKKHSAMKVA